MASNESDKSWSPASDQSEASGGRVYGHLAVVEQVVGLDQIK